MAIQTAPEDPTIVIVSYQSGAVLCQPHWADFFARVTQPVLIIDNGSPDGSGELLASKYPQHSIIRLPRNLGYGRAANHGFSRCRGRFALLLNPDLHISQAAINDLLMIAREDNGNGAVWAPALQPEDQQHSPPIHVEQVVGAAMLCDLDKIRPLGGFDENIFLYSEETDLCLRVRKSGHTIKYCPSVLMHHAGNCSSGTSSQLQYMKDFHFAWSRCYFLTKHQLHNSRRNPARLLRTYSLRSVFSFSRKKRDEYRAKAAGTRAFIKGEGAFDSEDCPRHSSFHCRDEG